MKSWHDTPRCEAIRRLRLGVQGVCEGPMVLVATAIFNHCANPGDRIVCCACGTGRPGTDAEVAQARKADAAWEAERARWEK